MTRVVGPIKANRFCTCLPCHAYFGQAHPVACAQNAARSCSPCLVCGREARHYPRTLTPRPPIPTTRRGPTACSRFRKLFPGKYFGPIQGFPFRGLNTKGPATDNEERMPGLRWQRLGVGISGVACGCTRSAQTPWKLFLWSLPGWLGGNMRKRGPALLRFCSTFL